MNANQYNEAVEPSVEICSKYIPPDWLTEPPPPIEFCLNPLLPIGAVTIINAHGGTGKSLFALKMVIHIVLGLDFLNAFTNDGKAAYMSLEDPEAVFRERFFKIANGMPDDITPRLPELTQKLMFIDMYGKPALMAGFVNGKVVESQMVTKLANDLKNSDIKCLVIDTFVRTHSLNENDNAQMGALLMLFEKIAKVAQCAVVLIHHQPKAGLSKDYASRGASAITDNARSVIHLEKVDAKDMDNFDEESIKTAIREGRLIRVTHTKHNYSAEHPEQYLELTADGVPMECFPIIKETDSMERRYSELFTWYIGQRQSKPITKTTIDEHYKDIRQKGTTHGKERYKKALQWAIDEGYAEKAAPPEDGSKNPRAEYYALSSPDKQ